MQEPAPGTSSRNSREEAILVERAISGDSDAFGELYMLHLDAIYRFVYYRIGETGEAEDLTEQVFLKAWEALPGYRSSGKPFTSWLYRIARNVVIDYHRQNRSAFTSYEQMNPDQVADGQESTLQKIITSEDHKLLARAIAELTEEQQQVIIFRFVEGMSHKEIAEILDKNESACRMMQYRALSTLQKILDTQG